MTAPLTDFEQSGTFTTLANETTFINQLVADGVAEVSVVGTSGQGRPIRLVRVGPGNKAPLMIIGAQHGNEPAGREAALMAIRDLAYTTDPALLAYLEEHSVWCVPTANPDGRNANTRDTPSGTNVNREHMLLTSPEAKALARVTRDAMPHIILDLHEQGLATYETDIASSPGEVSNIHPGIAALVREVVDDYVAPGILADGGWTLGPYVSTANSQWEAGSMRNAGCLRHAVAILSESHTDRPITERVPAQRAVVREVIQWHAARGAAIEAASNASVRAKEAEGINQSRPFELGTGTFVNPPATGYRLTEAQLATVKPSLDALGIMVENGIVWSHQRAHNSIPYILDPSSDERTVAAERIFDEPYPYRFEWFDGWRWRETLAQDTGTGDHLAGLDYVATAAEEIHVTSGVASAGASASSTTRKVATSSGTAAARAAAVAVTSSARTIVGTAAARASASSTSRKVATAVGTVTARASATAITSSTHVTTGAAIARASASSITGNAAGEIHTTSGVAAAGARASASTTTRRTLTGIARARASATSSTTTSRLSVASATVRAVASGTITALHQTQGVAVSRSLASTETTSLRLTFGDATAYASATAITGDAPFIPPSISFDVVDATLSFDGVSGATIHFDGASDAVVMSDGEGVAVLAPEQLATAVLLDVRDYSAILAADGESHATLDSDGVASATLHTP